MSDKISTDPLKFTYIRDITSNMKNINCQFIVLDVPPARKTKDGFDVRTIRVADKSGSINFAVWNEIGACLLPGDICRLINGYVSTHKLCLTLNCGKLGELQKVGEFCMLFTEIPNMSAPNNDLVKVAEQLQPKPPTGDNNGNGNFGSGGGPASGGNGSSGPPAKIPRTDGFQSTKSNGTGHSQTSRSNFSTGNVRTGNRKRKFLLDNPENIEQKNATQNNNIYHPYPSSYNTLQNNTKMQTYSNNNNEDFSPIRKFPYDNNVSINCSTNSNVNFLNPPVNFINAPVIAAENLFTFSFPSSAGGWFKPMSRLQTEQI